MKKRSRLALGLTMLLLVLAIGCAAYVRDYYAADEGAAAALAGSGRVTVRELDNLTVFTPEKPTAGFLFYPGGKVEAAAYAPLMLALAERELLCVLISMPCNLAVLNPNAARGIPERFPEVERWYIGGHSLGGSMAAGFAAKHPQELKGLVLLASYATADLTGSGLEVLSLYGTEDGVLNMEKYEGYRKNLPAGTQEIAIPGGNHGGFGSYGFQDGDGEAEISSSSQWQITAEAIAEWVNTAKNG